MTKHALRTILLIVTCGVAHASAPGTPFDCADWEIFDPGVTCTNAGSWDASGGYVFGSDTAVDTLGRLLRVVTVPQGFVCGSSFQISWSVVQVLENGVWTDLVRLSDRCVDSSLSRTDSICAANGAISFDPIAGRLYFFVANRYNVNIANSNRCAGFNSKWVAAFDGFPALFDLRQSYEPPQSLSLLVPAQPEGLRGADRLDTYWGMLGGPIDLASATPLRCDYPSNGAHFGDRITTADSLPNPSVGTGYWYLTSVTYQGETRAGRRAVHGELQGRDASVLPACELLVAGAVPGSD